MRALALAVAGLALAACETLPDAEPTASVSGNVIYLERIAPPQGGVLTVALQDVSLADAPATVIAEQTTPITTAPPYPFALTYEPARINPRGRYAVRAEIRDAAGALAFTTTDAYEAITQGAPIRLDVIVRRPHAEAPPAADPLPEAPGETGADVWRDLRARGIDFRAVGNEPGWLLDLYPERFQLEYDYGNESLTGALPPPTHPAEGLTRYDALTASGVISVMIQRTPCQDVMSGETFPARVSVSVSGRLLEGCGRGT